MAELSPELRKVLSDIKERHRNGNIPPPPPWVEAPLLEELAMALNYIALDFRDRFALRAYRHEFMLDQWALDPDSEKNKSYLLMYVRDQQKYNYGMPPKIGDEYGTWADEHDAQFEWLEA